MAGAKVTTETEAGDAALVDQNDVLLVPGENLTLLDDPIVTVKSGQESHTFNDENAAFSVSEDPQAPGILITVNSTPTEPLPIEGLTVESTTGIDCEVGQAGALTGALAATRSGDTALRSKDGKTATVSGTVTEKSGEPALKMSSGKTLKLLAKADKGEKRLEALVKKDAKVKVRGKKDGDTLEVTKVKSTKVKKK